MLALLASVAMQAASPAAEAPVVSDGCELHVWAAPGLGATRHTAWDGLDTGYMGMLGTTPQKRIEYDTAVVQTFGATPNSPLTTDQQLAVLKSLSLGALLGLAQHRLVVHEAPLESRTLRTPARFAPEGAVCYAELVLSDVVFSREYANGQNLKSQFRFRDFGTSGTPQRRFTTWVQTDLKIARDGKKADFAASNAELPGALTENTRKFAAFLGNMK